MKLQRLAKGLSDIQGLLVKRDVNLSPLTTMKTGGVANIFLLPGSIASLEKTLSFLRGNGISFKIFGNGSNLIVAEDPEVVLSLSLLKKVTLEEQSLVAQSGCLIWQAIKFCMENGLGGLEPLFGIPGSIGGAVFMNAGAGGISVGNFLSHILLTSEHGSYWKEVDDLTFSYRKANIPEGCLVSAVRFRVNRTRLESKAKKMSSLLKSRPEDSRKKIRFSMKKRAKSQPIGFPSSGCIFKNPKHTPAWQLISLCGLKGYSVNDAQISKKHANFIINRGKARASDILKLIELTKERVLRETNTLLREEVVIWNDDNGI